MAGVVDIEIEQPQDVATFCPNEDGFRRLRSRCENALVQYNSLGQSITFQGRGKLFMEMLPNCVTSSLQVPKIRTPFYVDYGLHVYINLTAFIDRGCRIVDTPVANIIIGKHVWIGPGVTLTSAGPPCSPESMRRLESGRRKISGAPITICDGAFIGAAAVIGPGVTIGQGAVVAPGAVVLGDVPEFSEAIGNPAKIKVPEADPVARNSRSKPSGSSRDQKSRR